MAKRFKSEKDTTDEMTKFIKKIQDVDCFTKDLVLDVSPTYILGLKKKCGSMFYVRQCHIDIAEQIMEHYNTKSDGVFIKGAPGIGKSCFIGYILYYFLKKCQDVNCFYFYRGSDWEKLRILFDEPRNSGKQWKFDVTKMSESGVSCDESAVCFYMGYTKSDIDEDHFKFFVTECTPSVNDGRLWKWLAPLYMPVWKLDELKACCNKCSLFEAVTNERIDVLYSVWGGSARLVLLWATKPDERHITYLQRALEKTKLSRLQLAEPSSANNRDFAHVLVHDDTADYKMKTRKFASDIVKYMLFDRADEKTYMEFFDMTLQHRDLSLNPNDGYAYQDYVLDLLAVGVENLSLYRLLDDGKSEPEQYSFPHRHMYRFRSSTLNDVVRSCTSEQLIVPMDGNYPGIDAIILPNILLQVTVSEQHDIERDSVQRLANLLFHERRETGEQQSNILYMFVMPQATCANFKKQKYKQGDVGNVPEVEGVVQFCLALDFDEDMREHLRRGHQGKRVDIDYQKLFEGKDFYKK